MTACRKGTETQLGRATVRTGFQGLLERKKYRDTGGNEGREVGRIQICKEPYIP